MSLSNSAENNLLLHLFNNADWANIGDASGLQNSAAAGNFYVALHTADPGEAGTAATSEATFTSYNRVAVARSGAGWTVSGTAPTTVSNAAAVTFPACGGGSNTITYFSITVSGTPGATSEIICSGALSSFILVTSGVIVNFPIGALTVTVD